jgi:hypothetical protein
MLRGIAPDLVSQELSRASMRFAFPPARFGIEIPRQRAGVANATAFHWRQTYMKVADEEMPLIGGQRG